MLVEQQLAMLVKLENTMIKRNAQQSLIAKFVKLGNTMIKLERLLIAKFADLENTMTKRKARQRLIVKLVRLVKNQQVIKKPVFSLVHRRWCTQNGRLGNARMEVLVRRTSRRGQRARRELVQLVGVT